MRIDKFLKVSRILKRRSLSKEACDGGRVTVNGKDAKPSHRLSVGDVVEIKFGSGNLKFKITDLKEHVKKEDAGLLYEILGE